MKPKYFLACLLTALFVLSTYPQSTAKKMMRLNTEPIKVGEQAPDFTLTDDAGTTITLSKLKQSVVLVFYRGYW